MPGQSRNTAPAAKKPKSKEEEIVVLDMQKLIEGEPKECTCDKTKSVHLICALHRVMRMIPLCTKQVRCTECVRAVEENTGHIGEPKLVSNHIIHNMNKMPRAVVDTYEEAMKTYGLRKHNSFQPKTIAKCLDEVPEGDPFYEHVRGIRTMPLPILTLAEGLARTVEVERGSDDESSSSAMLSDDDEEGSEASPRKQPGQSPHKGGADAVAPREVVHIRNEDRSFDSKCRLMVKTPVDYPPWTEFQRYQLTETFFCYQPVRVLAFLYRDLTFRCIPFHVDLLDCTDPWKLATADKKIDVKQKGKRTNRAANKSAKPSAQGTRHQPPRASTQYSSARATEPLDEIVVEDPVVHTFTTNELAVAMQTSASTSADVVQLAMQQAHLPSQQVAAPVQQAPTTVQTLPVPNQPMAAPFGLRQSGNMTQPRDKDPVWDYMCWNGIYLCNNSQGFDWPDVMTIIRTYASGVEVCYVQRPHQFHPPEDAAQYKAFLTGKLSLRLTRIMTPLSAEEEQKARAQARLAIQHVREEAKATEILPQQIIDPVSGKISVLLPGTSGRDIDSDSVCTGLTGGAEPKRYKVTDVFKYQQRLPFIAALLTMWRRRQQMEFVPHIGTIVGVHQCGQELKTTDRSFVGLGIAPENLVKIKELYEDYQKQAHVWGKHLLYTAPCVLSAYRVPSAPYDNVTNCNMLTSRRPDFNTQGPDWYDVPEEYDMTRAQFTIEALRRNHRQALKAVRVGNFSHSALAAVEVVRKEYGAAFPADLKEPLEVLKQAHQDLITLTVEMEFRMRYMLRAGVLQRAVLPDGSLPFTKTDLKHLLTDSPLEMRTVFSESKLFPYEGEPDLTFAERAMARTPDEASPKDPGSQRRKSTPQKIAQKDGLSDDGDSPMRDDPRTPGPSYQRRESTAIQGSVSSAAPTVSSSQSQLDPGRSASEVEDIRMDQDTSDLNDTEPLKSPRSVIILPNADESYDDTA